MGGGRGENRFRRRRRLRVRKGDVESWCVSADALCVFAMSVASSRLSLALFQTESLGWILEARSARLCRAMPTPGFVGQAVFSRGPRSGSELERGRKRGDDPQRGFCGLTAPNWAARGGELAESRSRAIIPFSPSSIHSAKCNVRQYRTDVVRVRAVWSRPMGDLFAIDYLVSRTLELRYIEPRRILSSEYW